MSGPIKTSVFDQYARQHRKHQQEAIESALSSPIGQVIIPTGTGKTRIQVHLHIKDMLEKATNDKAGVYLIAAHRLILCRQLIMQLIDLVAACNLPFDVVFVGSDKVDEDDIYERHMIDDVSKKTTFITATTKQVDIRNAVDAAGFRGRHVLIVSTYHSLDHLRMLTSIDVATYDEAHTIASSRDSEDNFEAHVKEIQKLNIIKRQYFFTATRKVSGVLWGMNNKSIYGDVIYESSPREMILAGEIVPPRVHRVVPKDTGEFKNDTMLVKTIEDAFLKHKSAVSNASPRAGKIGAKLLISAEGTPEVRTIIFNEDFQRWCIKNSVRLFVFSSILGTYMIDSDFKFCKASRNEVTDQMQSLKDEQDAILIHIDILSEGIDLPSITGVMPFRELNLIKLLQTIGRASRLIKEDRKSIYRGDVGPMEFNKMIKPYCWIIFPKLNTDTSEASKKMEEMLQTVLKLYDAPEMNFNREDEYIGDPDNDLDPITPKDSASKNDAVSELDHVIEALMFKGDSVTVEELDKKLTAVINPALRL